MAGSSCRLDGSRDGKACLTGKQNKTKNYLTEIWNCWIDVQFTIMQEEGGSHRSLFFTQVSVLAQQEPVCRLVTCLVTVDGGSVGGGRSDFFGRAGDGSASFQYFSHNPRFGFQSQAMGTLRTSIVLLEWNI